MSTFDAIRSTFGITDMVLTSYVGDMSDAELMTRPGAGCNHIAWQLGHLISSESNLISMVKEGSGMELPDGFAAAHSKETVGVDDASKFCSKEEYMDLYKKSRENSLATLESMSEEDLKAESPENFKAFAPTLGDLAILIATHPLMHAGQVVPCRRALDKPVVI